MAEVRDADTGTSTAFDAGALVPVGDVVPLRRAVRAWFSISLQTFGGPAGQIAVMQRHLVDERRRIGQRRFLHALNYCMLLLGPEAQQLAIYVGWLPFAPGGSPASGSPTPVPRSASSRTLLARQAWSGMPPTR